MYFYCQHYADIQVTQQSFFSFFALPGRLVAPMGMKFGVNSSMPNFNPIGAELRRGLPKLEILTNFGM